MLCCVGWVRCVTHVHIYTQTPYKIAVLLPCSREVSSTDCQPTALDDRSFLLWFACSVRSVDRILFLFSFSFSLTLFLKVFFVPLEPVCRGLLCAPHLLSPLLLYSQAAAARRPFPRALFQLCASPPQRNERTICACVCVCVCVCRTTNICQSIGRWTDRDPPDTHGQRLAATLSKYGRLSQLMGGGVVFCSSFVLWHRKELKINKCFLGGFNGWRKLKEKGIGKIRK